MFAGIDFQQFVDDPLSKPWFYNDYLRQLVIKNNIDHLITINKQKSSH